MDIEPGVVSIEGPGRDAEYNDQPLDPFDTEVREDDLLADGDHVPQSRIRETLLEGGGVPDRAALDELIDEKGQRLPERRRLQRHEDVRAR